MADPALALSAVILSYLTGSLSFPWAIARLYGVDLQREGSRKLGGGNLIATVGVVPGVIGGLLDAAKGLLAVVAARSLGLPVEVQLACGIAANVGQMWPVFHRFDGGRANATGWGFALAADPIAAAIMGIPLLAALVGTSLARPRPTRLFPLASLLSFLVFPAVIWEQEGVTPTVIGGALLAALILIRRVTAGVRLDLETGAPVARVVVNRALYDRSELQQRGVVPI
ncbi:MAG TPA: glycerol-3-phosphate acyltransferase [Candidatus Limnocylindrales bacterium]|nr:glycerol-3-phosphate acyltransferase [Candidatus Limnocylindrales bacterium]